MGDGETVVRFRFPLASASSTGKIQGLAIKGGGRPAGKVWAVPTVGSATGRSGCGLIGPRTVRPFPCAGKPSAWGRLVMAFAPSGASRTRRSLRGHPVLGAPAVVWPVRPSDRAASAFFAIVQL